MQGCVRRLSVLIFGFVIAFGTSQLFAQIHGVPASVTSLGFGGSNSFAPGVAASVTSLGPNGYGVQRTHFNNCCFNVFGQSGSQFPISMRGHRGRRNFFAGSVPVYGVPYTQVVVVQPDSDLDDQEDDSGGPTIFDRRGGWRSGRTRRPAPEVVSDAAPQPVVASVPPAPVVAQPSTLLVFRDGHQAELQNYAIVGDTIFDLTDNRSHKILLADVDLTATRRANDERGVDFQVPAQ